MDELQRQTGGGLLFSSHLMKAEEPAESFPPFSLGLLVLSEKHSPHRGEVKEAVKEREEEGKRARGGGVSVHRKLRRLLSPAGHFSLSRGRRTFPRSHH